MHALMFEMVTFKNSDRVSALHRCIHLHCTYIKQKLHKCRNDTRKEQIKRWKAKKQSKLKTKCKREKSELYCECECICVFYFIPFLSYVLYCVYFRVRLRTKSLLVRFIIKFSLVRVLGSFTSTERSHCDVGQWWRDAMRRRKIFTARSPFYIRICTHSKYKGNARGRCHQIHIHPLYIHIICTYICTYLHLFVHSIKYFLLLFIFHIYFY